MDFGGGVGKRERMSEEVERDLRREEDVGNNEGIGP